MMIFGSRIWEEISASGQFYCPKCNSVRCYQQKCAIKHADWRALSLNKVQILDEFVECQFCKQTFNIEVLQYNSGLPSARLLLSIKFALESGHSVETLRDELICFGMNASGAMKLVNSAIENQYYICPGCGTRQVGKLLRCKQCSEL